jgi:Fe-S-cluster-containing hydrogenase component 2
MTRYEELKEIFADRRCFKLVCGAGNEDVEEVRRLATIYTLAGVTMLDLSANPDVVRAATKGVDAAYKLGDSCGRKVTMRPYLNVSIGLKGDPHVRKAAIDSIACNQCGACLDACGQQAINKEFIVLRYKCIGCGKCEEVCASGAITFSHKKVNFRQVLPRCIDVGTETLELHAVTSDDRAVMRDWRLLNSLVTNNFISICLDRSLLSNRHLIERVRALREVTGERMIVQADGVPMSGEGDDFNTTLQAVACADIVAKADFPVVILLSGGTNSKTGILARQCGVKAHGVAVGSFARKQIKHLVARPDFDENMDSLMDAVSMAESLIRSNLEAIHG